MALRHIVAAIVLAFVVVQTLRRPKFGVLAFLVILYLTPASLFWGLDEWRIPLVVSISLLVATVIHASQRNRNLTGGAIFVWWAGLVCALVLSSVASIDVERSVGVLFDYWLKTFIFVWLLLTWTQSEQDLRHIFTVLVACFSLLALRAIYRYAVGYPELTGATGTMGDRNDFALHVAMVVPIAYFMAQSARALLAKWFFALSAILMVVSTALTFSRMGFLLLLAAGVMLWWSSAHKLRNLIVVAFLAVSFLAFLPDAYFARMSTIRSYDQDASAMGRITAWDAGMRMGLENPLTGVGLKCFELPEVYYKYAASGSPHVAHNAYVQLFSEAGVFALIFWLLLLLTALTEARGLANARKQFATRCYATAMLHSLVIYLVGSMFLNAAYFELPYLIVAGVVALRTIHRPDRLLKLARDGDAKPVAGH